MLSRNRLCLLDGKNSHKSSDHLFDLNCFDSMIHTIIFQSSVMSFLIWVAEVPRNNSFLSAILYFSTSVPVFLFAVLQSLSLLFLCKNFLQLRKTLALTENLYFSRFVPSLASDCKKDQKLWQAVQKQILSAWRK